MVVAVCQLALYLPESRSLKNKRQVVNSLKERLHNRFNLSVAEVGDNELWQRCSLALAIVTNARDHADSVLGKAVNFVEGDVRVQILDCALEER